MPDAPDRRLAAIMFPELVKLAQARTTITYGDLAERLGRDRTKEGLAISSSLKSLHRWCSIHQYPSIDALVVSKESYEVGSWLGDKIDPVGERQRVFDFDWQKVSNPTDRDLGSLK